MTTRPVDLDRAPSPLAAMTVRELSAELAHVRARLAREATASGYLVTFHTTQLRRREEQLTGELTARWDLPAR